TPPELIELSRSLRASGFREITQIRLPFAVPYIFSALKISITLAVIGAVVAEFCASEAGPGLWQLEQGGRQLDEIADAGF
ncbi:ABC transporter permease, partial [Rhizobium ruizarguesonis]